MTIVAVCLATFMLVATAALSLQSLQRRCMHHQGAESFVTGQLVDSGTRKMWRCSKCGQVWFR